MALMAQPQKEVGKLSQARVVIADDESIIRMDLKEMLSGLGYQIVGEASDGKQAINLARELKPDLVITDDRFVIGDHHSCLTQFTYLFLWLCHQCHCVAFLITG